MNKSLIYLFMSLIAINGVFAIFNEEVYYTFDNTLTDSSGNGNDGTITGAETYVAAVVNEGLDFTGTNNYVSTGYIIGNDGTICFWERQDVNASLQYLTGFQLGKTTGININASNYLVAYVDNFQINANYIEKDVFYHICLTWDSGTLDTGLYVNGSLVGSGTFGGSTDATQARIATATTGANYFNGVIDEYYIWNRSLSSTEIAQLYQSYQQNGIYLSSKDSLNLSQVYPVTYTLYNGTGTSDFLNATTNTTASGAYFNYSNGNYTVVVNASGYLTQTLSFEHINLTTTSFILVRDSAVAFTFYDEQTETPIFNVSYELIGTYNTSGTTNSSFLNFTGLSSNTYQLVYNKTGYGLRNYYFYIPLADSAYKSVNLYLLNESEGDYYLPSVLTQAEQPYEGFFQALRWYDTGGGTGQYRVVEVSKVNAQGTTAMFLEFNTAFYIFRAIDLVNNTVDATYNTPKRLFNQQETYRVITDTGYFVTFDSLATLQGTKINYYNATIEYIDFAYSNKPEGITQICLELRRVSGINESTAQNCNFAESGINTIQFNTTANPGAYSAIAYAVDSAGITYPLANLEINRINNGVFPSQYKTVGLLVGFFVALTGGFLAVSIPLVGIIIMLGGVGLLGASVLGVVPFGGVFLVTMIAIGIMVAVMIRK